MFANTLSKLSTHHASYMTRFYNRKLTSVGTVIGASCGLIYLSEYYAKRKCNDAVNKYSNPFSMVINPRAPESLNIFTTTITGAVLGYIFTLYWPVTIPLGIGYNLATFNESD